MFNTTVNKGNFKKKLAGALRQDKSLRDNVQELIVFGFLEYDSGKNSNWLTDIMNAGFKSVRLAAVQEYVEGHTDLIWTRKAGSDKSVFKREAVEGYKFTMPTVTWYDYSKAGLAKPFDDLAAFPNLIRTLESTMKTDAKRPIPEGHEANVKAMINHLRSYTPILPEVIAETEKQTKKKPAAKRNQTIKVSKSPIVETVEVPQGMEAAQG